MSSIDIGHNQQKRALDPADRLPALLAGFDPVLFGYGERVVKHERRKLEADAVLPQVGLGLRWIPFETDIGTEHVSEAMVEFP